MTQVSQVNFESYDVSSSMAWLVSWPQMLAVCQSFVRSLCLAYIPLTEQTLHQGVELFFFVPCWHEGNTGMGGEFLFHSLSSQSVDDGAMWQTWRRKEVNNPTRALLLIGELLDARFRWYMYLSPLCIHKSCSVYMFMSLYESFIFSKDFYCNWISILTSALVGTWS